jgi:hypothetical protein
MKYNLIFIMSLCVNLSLCAQNDSELTPSTLLFSDQSDPLTGTIYGYNFFNIQSDFNYSSGAPGILSAGDDLQFSSIDKDGFTVQQSGVFSPSENANLGTNALKFTQSGFGIDEIFWKLGTSQENNGAISLEIEEFDFRGGLAFSSIPIHIGSFTNTGNAVGLK